MVNLIPKSVLAANRWKFLILANFFWLPLPGEAYHQTELAKFEIKICGIKECVSAKGRKAQTSALTSLIAASQVSLEMSDGRSYPPRSITCDSFTFDLSASYLTCETVENGRQVTLTWNASDSRFYRYERGKN